MSRWLIQANDDNLQSENNEKSDIFHNIDKKFMEEFKDGNIPSKESPVWKDLLDLAFSRQEKDKGSFSTIVEMLRKFGHDLVAELVDSLDGNPNSPYEKYKILKLDGKIIVTSDKIMSFNKNDITFTTSKGDTFYSECLKLFNDLSYQEKQWLCNGVYRDDLKLILKSIAYYGDKLVGFCDAIPYNIDDAKTVYLLICVDKNYRGQGIASSLVKLIEEVLPSTGYIKVVWKVNIDNKRSIDLAEQNSYNYTGTNKDEMYYSKILKNKKIGE